MKLVLNFLIFASLSVIVFSQAIAVSAQVLQRAAPKPGTVASLLEEAGAAFGKRDFKRAAELCKQAATLAPKNSKAHRCLANSYYESRQFEPAVNAYAKYFKLGAKPEFETLMPYADSYLEMEQYEKAIPLLKQAVGLTTDPSFKAGAENRLANAYFEIDDFEKAIPLYIRVTRFAPKNADALYNLGMCYMYTGKKTEARAIQKKLEPIHPFLAGNLQLWIDGKK